jgi:membrane dipeptidase
LFSFFGFGFAFSASGKGSAMTKGAWNVADLHCDVLCKMLEHADLQMDEPEGGRLDVTRRRLRQGDVSLQVFAMYLPSAVPRDPQRVFEMAELFYSRVLSQPEMKPIRTAEHIAEAQREGKIGALLSLEGADGLQGNFWALRLLHRLGLRLIGPTWNDANWAADGAMEPRAAGLTKAGKKLVAECERLGILLDVSHLSERAFWDLAESATKPFFASHSNVFALREHPRNLKDDQIRAILAVDGLVGLSFVPWFLASADTATIDDVLRNVDYVC